MQIGKNKLLILAISLVVLAVFGFVLAGQEHNVSEWAWSENVGWLSFNNLSGGGNINYGVNIDPQTGIFSGYAWSENIGWITFNESELSGCPQAPCRAWLETTTDKVYGWAKALAGGTTGSGGWDGWIKLRGTTQRVQEYGVWLDRTATPTPELMGWAWGGGNDPKSAVVGWVSFNCKNEQGANCPLSNYKVVVNLAVPPQNQPPTVSDPRFSSAYCDVGPGLGQITFSWLYQDPNNDPQSQYWLQVATDPQFNNLAVDCTSSQPVNPGQRGSATVRVTQSPRRTCQPVGEIAYNTTYYWRVKVRDSGQLPLWSEWATGTPFTTITHPKPWPEFTWTPQTPVVNQTIWFDPSSSTIFNGLSRVHWDFDGTSSNDPYYQTITTTTLGMVINAYQYRGGKDVTLTITDTSGYSCSLIQTIGIEQQVPPNPRRYEPREY
jgi:hypothetical protein